MEASKNTEVKGTTNGSSDELVEINTTPQYAGITEGQVAPKHQVARPNDRTTAQVGLEFAGRWGDIHRFGDYGRHPTKLGGVKMCAIMVAEANLWLKFIYYL